MLKRTILLSLIALFVLYLPAQLTNVVTYAGSSGREAFLDVVQLSDGTFLVGGYAEDLAWISSQVPIVPLPNPGLSNGQGTNRYAILIQFSSDLQQMLRVLHFPQGAAEDIRFIKTTNAPGTPTGDIYISGNTSDTRQNDGGYFVARLNDNFVNGIPTDCDWAYNIWAEGYPKEIQPWDVDGQGRVTFIRGQSHAYDWSSVHRLDADGMLGLVPNWRTHWDIGVTEYRGVAANYPNGGADSLDYSGIVLKEWGRCDLRSWTQQDYLALQGDGNGGLRQGAWPLDVFYDEPCDPGNATTTGPGYTGYSQGNTPVHGGSAIAVDRRNGDIYLGLNVKSVLPDGNPDFEPAVVAFDADGGLKWWSRLYHEISPTGDTLNSSPDQYIDGLAVDYSQGPGDAHLVVNARCHGNNVENFWEGNTIAATPSAAGFQNRFTGTNGNIHISWLGKLKLSNGTLEHSTYVAEYAEGTGGLGGAHPDPNLAGWPNPNGGWPNVNTTRLTKGTVKVTMDGSVCIIGQGRRTITTANAYQKMVLPGNGGFSSWNNFVRVYQPDLGAPSYSSLVVGAWDTLTQAGGGNTTLQGVFKTGNGIVAVGYQQEDPNNPGQAKGNDVPVVNVPVWGSNVPSGQSALLVLYESDSLVNPADDPAVVTNAQPGLPPLDFRIFPNPSHTAVHALFPGTEAFSMEVCDLRGQVLIQIQGEGNHALLTPDRLAPGIYLVKATQNGRTSIRKLIKN